MDARSCSETSPRSPSETDNDKRRKALEPASRPKKRPSPSVFTEVELQTLPLMTLVKKAKVETVWPGPGERLGMRRIIHGWYRHS